VPLRPVCPSGAGKGWAWEAELESPDDAGDVLPFEGQERADSSQSAAARKISTTSAEVYGAKCLMRASKYARVPSDTPRGARTSIAKQVAIRYSGRCTVAACCRLLHGRPCGC
jgi:hypothetical protein